MPLDINRTRGEFGVACGVECEARRETLLDLLLGFLAREGVGFDGVDALFDLGFDFDTAAFDFFFSFFSFFTAFFLDFFLGATCTAGESSSHSSSSSTLTPCVKALYSFSSCGNERGGKGPKGGSWSDVIVVGRLRTQPF